MLLTRKAFLLLALLSAGLYCQISAVAQSVITTFAGGGPDHVAATTANLWSIRLDYGPVTGITTDTGGDYFISSNNRVFQVDPAGVLTVVAGAGALYPVGDGGSATSANLASTGAAVDASGNLFIADIQNQTVRRVDAATGIISTVAGNGDRGYSGDGGPATSASLNRPTGVAVDAAGNLFIADYENFRIRRVDATTGIISTVAGGGTNGLGDGGPATSASLSWPIGVTVDWSGNLLIADTFDNRIRRVDAASGIITTIAGNGVPDFDGDGGPATSARLYLPTRVALDATGNLFIADYLNNRVRRVDATTGIISTVAGNGTNGFSGDGGPATSAAVGYPSDVALDSSGNLLISTNGLDGSTHLRIRCVDAATGVINTVAGNGTDYFSGEGVQSTSASMSNLMSVGVDGTGNVFIGDYYTHRVRRVDAATGIITTVAGNGTSGFSGDGGPATSASLSPLGVAIDATGNLFIADIGNLRIRRVDAATGVISTVAGDGTRGFSGDGGLATSAQLSDAGALAVDPSGNLYIADTANQRIRRVDAASGIITTVAGNGTSGFSGDGGPASSASLNNPLYVAVDASSNLFIADNQRVRRVDAVTGVITTVAGDGTPGFAGDGGPATTASVSPVAVAVDSSGDLFIASLNRIRRVDAASGIIDTVAGNGDLGFSGDGGPPTSATLSSPNGVAVDGYGNLFIVDSDNDRIRVVQ